MILLARPQVTACTIPHVPNGTTYFDKLRELAVYPLISLFRFDKCCFLLVHPVFGPLIRTRSWLDSAGQELHSSVRFNHNLQSTSDIFWLQVSVGRRVTR